MLIHALDPGRLCGFAVGPAGTAPVSGVVELRKDDEHRSIGLYNLEQYLKIAWKYRKPDLLVYEPPMTVQAWIENAKRTGRWHGGDSLTSAIELSGCIQATCLDQGVQFQPVSRTAIMWAITGKAGWGEYKLNKAKIIEGLRLQRMIPEESKDDNRADAVAAHVFASGKYAKNRNSNFGLFAGKSA